MFKKTISLILMIGGSTVAQAQTVGITVNQNAVGARLSAPVGVPDLNAATVISATVISDPVLRANALAQLTPQAYSLVPEVSLNAVEAQETNILRYVRDLRAMLKPQRVRR